MKKYFKNITKPFLIVFTLLFSALSLAQTYNPLMQNEAWNSDASQSTIFFKGSADLEITPSLKMFLFEDQDSNQSPKATVGGGWVDTSTYSNHGPIPSNWEYEILSATNSTISADKKKVTFTDSPDATLTLKLKVTDGSGNVIPNLGEITLKLFIRGNFTVSTETWNACEQARVINVNEVTLNGGYPCRPYRMIVYEEKDESSTVKYDSNNDSEHNPNDNTFTIKNLPPGTYWAVITNSCGDRVFGENGFYPIAIVDSYAFGASVVFAGFACIDDSLGQATIQIEGAAVPITWTLIHFAQEKLLFP